VDNILTTGETIGERRRTRTRRCFKAANTAKTASDSPWRSFDAVSALWKDYRANDKVLHMSRELRGNGPMAWIIGWIGVWCIARCD